MLVTAGYTHEEIADRLGCSESSVSSRMAELRAELVGLSQPGQPR
jgi:DNA-directed RNA polymerase specialized sigma24 family protein